MSDLAETNQDIPLQLTAEDRVFVGLLEQGFSKPEAYVEAYAENETVQKHLAIINRYQEAQTDSDMLKTPDELFDNEPLAIATVENRMRMLGKRAYVSKQRLGQLAREKARTKKIRMAFNTLVRRMEDLAVDALDVWEDIMLNGKSEKVRADLATRAVEHQTGQPTQKVISQSNNEITITIGEAPPDTRNARQVAIDKARMTAGLGDQPMKKVKETPQDAMIIDIEE